MRKAICTINDVMYEAVNFEQDKHFEIIKTTMICPECKEPAFFRGVTQNGREACFGAKHKDGCTLATSDHDDQSVSQPEDQNALITDRRIVVNFGLGLTPLLSSLIESEEFRTSDMVIEVIGYGEYVTSDLFVNLADVTEEHLGCFRGYWGKIHFAKADQKETLWFNTADPTAPSVTVDKKHREPIFQRFNINDAAEISGAYILVFGEMQKGKNTDKKFVLVTDPNNFTVILSDKSKSEPKTDTKQATYSIPDQKGQNMKIMTQEEGFSDLQELIDTITFETSKIRNHIRRSIPSDNPDRNNILWGLQEVINLSDYVGVRLYALTHPIN